MAIKTILMPLRQSDATAGLLETGPELARRFDAHLEVLHVRPDPRAALPFATVGLSRGLQDTVREAAEHNARDEADALRAQFEAACKTASLPVVDADDPAGRAGAAWVEMVGQRDERIARRGRLADLVVVPRPSRVSPPPRSFQAALFQTGRPVLMVPRVRAGPVTLGHVAIGWNGSKEVAQAVAAAGPCLAGAERVIVVSTEKRMHKHPNASEVVTYLARHGIDARVHIMDPGKRTVGAALVDETARLGVDLLVIGGYSSPRLREFVMGGVTRHLFTRAEIPVLMVH